MSCGIMNLDVAELLCYRAPMLALFLALTMQQQQQVSICEVLKRPADYRRRVISIPAEILLALPHGAILLDKNCSKRALRLGVDLPDADSTATNLVSLILNDCPSPRPDRVAGTFIGKLAYSADGRINLRLLSVEGLQAHPCEKPDVSVPNFSPTLPNIMR
jgi:hypothetical protein